MPRLRKGLTPTPRIIFQNPQLAEDVYQVVGLTGDTKAFRFSRPIEVVHEVEKGVHSHWCEELRLLGYGKTCSESWDDFAGAFEFDWDDIAEASDESLTKGAQQLKKKLHSLVSSVDAGAVK